MGPMKREGNSLFLCVLLNVSRINQSTSAMNLLSWRKSETTKKHVRRYFGYNWSQREFLLKQTCQQTRKQGAGGSFSQLSASSTSSSLQMFKYISVSSEGLAYLVFHSRDPRVTSNHEGRNISTFMYAFSVFSSGTHVLFGG